MPLVSMAAMSFVSNKVWRTRSFHLGVFLLSIAAHAGVGYILQDGVYLTGQAALPQGAIRSITTVSLVAQTVATRSDHAIAPVSTESSQAAHPDFPVFTLGANAIPATGYDDFLGNSVQAMVPQSGVDRVPVPPAVSSGFTYVQSGVLTKKPQLVRDIPPDFAIPMSHGLLQLVVLHLLINEYGDIDRVIVDDSSLPESVQESLIDAFSKTEFLPGEINGVPVKSQLEIAVELGNAGINGGKVP